MQDKEIKALISLLDDDDQEILQHVENKILSIGYKIIPILEQEWEFNVNNDVQIRIENLIHKLQFDSVKHKLVEWNDNGANDLLEGMHIIATYQYPQLKKIALEEEIDKLYLKIKDQIKTDLHPYDQVRELNQFFFTHQKFQANKNNFYSPSNSFLNIVLESKKGIPLTMSIVYLLVAQEIGMPIYGVNLPNLFILMFKGKEKSFYINVYNNGLIFSREDIDNYVQQLDVSPLDIFYKPCSNSSIIKRCIRNLIGAYEHANMAEKVKEMDELLNLISKEEADF